MNDFEKAQQNLNIILERGDVYDTIALRESVKVPKYTFLRFHLLLFSRILYGGVLIYDKIKSFFSPIEKVRKAQEQIRDILGVNVDVVKSKKNLGFYDILHSKKDDDTYMEANLFLLYENNRSSIREYIEQLRKILNFCELHHLPVIVLRVSDITNSFPFIDLSDFQITNMKSVLNYEASNYVNSKVEDDYDIEEEFFTDFLLLSPSDLNRLIKRLEVVKIDKKTVAKLSKGIEDIAVLNAVNDFLNNGDLVRLKTLINQRLTLAINSDSSYKDKQFGKLYQNVMIHDQYIKIVSTDSNGEMVGSTVTTLYDYLEVLDYSSLLKQIKMSNDNREILQISALYLYLCKSMRPKIVRKSDNISFYDYIYKKYQEKRKHKIKRIPGLYNKDDKLYKRVDKIVIDAMLTAALLITFLVTGTALDFATSVLSIEKDSSILETMLEYVLTPYVRSFEFEKKLVENGIDKIRNVEFNLDFSSSFVEDFISTITGDVESGSKEGKVIASITPINSNQIPLYFATAYATSAHYENGQVEFQTKLDYISFSQMENVEPQFQVEYNISKAELQEALSTDNFMNLPQFLYPVGENYVLTNIKITDCDDLESKIEIYFADGAAYLRNCTREEAIKILNSMKKPRICCVYGISEVTVNSFTETIGKEGSYTENSSEEIRSAIIRGLNLSGDATNQEIFGAIQNKLYSLTPIKDARLTKKIKEMDEVEFYETIASLDSLICNLAATLAVGTDEDLVYIVGFYNSNDYVIREDEAHAWAMTEAGDIVDITPSTSEEKEEKNIIQSILVWGMKHHLPLVLIAALIGYCSYKLFGDDVKFYFALKKVEKTISNPDFDVIYASLKRAMYGGINLPVKKDLSETVKTVEQEFRGFSLEELKELQKVLKQSGLTGGELKTSLKLIDEIPFIRENSDDIQKVFQKRMK